MFLDGQYGTTVMFTLPELHLPEAAAGIRIGGPVSVEGVLAALYDGVRLATLLLCLGAANVLADPKRLLKSLPAALHEMGVAVTVALTVAPQLIESGQRIRKARKLRGATGARRGFVRGVLIPVLEDAPRPFAGPCRRHGLAGYGRRADQARTARMVTSVLVLAGIVGVCVGTYGVLDGTTPRALGGPMLVAGCVVAVIGIRARWPACATHACTAPIRGAPRNGWSSHAALRRRLRCSWPAAWIPTTCIRRCSRSAGRRSGCCRPSAR